MRRPILPVLLFLCGACAGAEEPSTHWDPSATADDHGLRCEADHSSYAPFSKACRDTRDCTMFSHVVSCCGDRVVIGLQVDGVDAFAASELACRQAYGDCDCEREPARAEDGNDDTSGEIIVHCDHGECSTYVRGAGGASGT